MGLLAAHDPTIQCGSFPIFRTLPEFSAFTLLLFKLEVNVESSISFFVSLLFIKNPKLTESYYEKGNLVHIEYLSDLMVLSWPFLGSKINFDKWTVFRS